MGVIVTHLFYIPVIIASLCWPGRGVLVALFLAVFLIGMDLFMGKGLPSGIGGNLARSAILCLVALICDSISKRRNRIEQAMRQAFKRLNTIYSMSDLENRRLLESLKASLERNKRFNTLHSMSDLENRRLLESLKASLERNREVYSQTIFALAMAIEAKNPYMRWHTPQVTLYTVEIAEKMGLLPDEIQKIRQAALLHDLGKVSLDRSIIDKKGLLTPEERAKIKKDSVAGIDILRPLEFIAEEIIYIRHHHERWDGTGYPDGLKGEDIPLASRILAVADAWAAMTSDRPHRPCLSKQQAISELRKNSGTQFDPNVVEEFIKIVEKPMDGDGLFRLIKGKKH